MSDTWWGIFPTYTLIPSLPPNKTGNRSFLGRNKFSYSFPRFLVAWTWFYKSFCRLVHSSVGPVVLLRLRILACGTAPGHPTDVVVFVFLLNPFSNFFFDNSHFSITAKKTQWREKAAHNDFRRVLNFNLRNFNNLFFFFGRGGFSKGPFICLYASLSSLYIIESICCQGRMDGWMDRRTNGRTNRWTDGRTD